MTTTNPSTGLPLPPDAIQRVLHITSRVHVYAVPPLTSAKGHTAATWTQKPAIFTARLRVLETALPTSSPSPSSPTATTTTTTLQTAILLEDPSTGELFAAAPYTHKSAVEQCLDSSRFFAVRVVDAGRKATLGIGFEERSDAFDFGVALQDAGKVMGLDGGVGQGQGQMLAQTQAQKAKGTQKVEEKKDYSLKEGEMITVNIGSKGRRLGKNSSGGGGDQTFGSGNGNGLGSAFPFLPPPPSADDVKREMRKSGDRPLEEKTAEELGFDDGEFGEFQ